MSPPFQKLNLSSRETVEVLGSAKIFKRLRYYDWLKPLEESRPGRPCLYPYSRIEAVQKRLESGEIPPPLPSEVRAESTIRDQAPGALPSESLLSTICPFRPLPALSEAV